MLRRLADRKGREREGLVLVEGPRVVETALARGARFRFALHAPGTGGEGSLIERLESAGVEVIAVRVRDLRALADTELAQGPLAVAEEPRPALPGEAPGERVLVLDAVQDPGNVGTLVRSAAAFRAHRVIALDGTADPWGPKAVRASAGLAFGIPIHRERAADALEWIGARGLPLLVADAGGRDVRTPGLPRDARGGCALLVANEGRGPRALAREHADAVVALPLAPGVESLNAAMAGSVLLWALGPGAAAPLPRTSEPE